MHPNQDASGENRRLFVSLQHPKPAPRLAFRFGHGLASRSPAKTGRKIKFAPSMERLGKCVPPHAKVRART